MISIDLINAGLLLGIFVLLAGCYGLFYTIGQLKQSRAWINAGYVCFVLQVAVTLLLVLFAPLSIGWQLLMIASCLASFKIPPMAWSYLELTHGQKGRKPC